MIGKLSIGIRCLLFVSLLSQHSLVTAQQDSLLVRFNYGPSTAKVVSVAGSFNNWSPDTNPMERSGSNWQTKIRIAPGYYYYKFVVDGQWIPDPVNKWRINDGGDGFNSIIKVGNPPRPVRIRSEKPFPKAALPRPVLEDNPEWVDLYYAAWEMAWSKIAHGTAQNGFAESYMDEGFNELIYQWDTCFMIAFGVYGRHIFPVMPSLDNFYSKQREDGYIQRVYWETNGEMANPPSSDEPMINPPLFAWMELRYYRITGDDSRLKRVLPVLINYFNWIENNCRTPAGKGLYYTSALGSGMDNTPRNKVGKAGWIDFSAQQALTAKAIAEIAAIIEDEKTAAAFSAKYSRIRDKINRQCWNPESKFYFDMTENSRLSPTKHIGAFWVLISEVCPQNRKEALLNHLRNPEEFWRPHLVPTLAADDPAYDKKGHYWLGSVWAPTNYMVVKGLEKYEQYNIAGEIAQNHIRNMSVVYRGFEPDENRVAFEERYGDGYQTIWECYAPEFPAPATRWDNTFYSRQDFVGWSGLGPIGMLIENVIGLEIVGSQNLILWRVSRLDRHGMENIQLRDQFVSLICKPQKDYIQIEIQCEKPFDLQIIWKDKLHTRKITNTVERFIVN